MAREPLGDPGGGHGRRDVAGELDRAELTGEQLGHVVVELVVRHAGAQCPCTRATASVEGPSTRGPGPQPEPPAKASVPEETHARKPTRGARERPEGNRARDRAPGSSRSGRWRRCVGGGG
ncbi:hypothetical protein CCE01nite_22420 [Cellulomonas cellasea]|uniref:Uncharacterized protein n=1 Tax=Cellulomonas cellasea TaxID=43670 RepID=A0A4Y3KW46_9CELL|nr:hypothetical protein CCE01nite_22420 [Cellulomonas cellasea]